MNTKSWFKFYPSDYLNDEKVTFLSAAAQGIYIRILCRLWESKDGVLPNDRDKILRLINVLPDEIVINAFDELMQSGVFSLSSDEKNIFQKRLKKERKDADARTEKAQNAAIARYATPCASNANAMHKQCLPTAIESKRESKNKSKNLELDLEKEKELREREEKEKTYIGASGAPDCPHKEIINLYHETLPELPKVKIWTKPRQQALQSRWREDKTRQSLEWWRDYFLKVEASDFLMGQVPGRNNAPPFVADLEWLIKPANMAKVIEGKYDNRKARNIYEQAAEDGCDKVLDDFMANFGKDKAANG